AAAVAVDTGTIVTIRVTPIGSDFGNSSARAALIRLVPPGIVVPPDGMQPAFTFTPTPPQDHQAVFFDAPTTVASPNNPIVNFAWDFGDGGRGSGKTTTHTFNSAGSFIVTLTVSDGFNRTATTSLPVVVGAGANPTANFIVSPANPLVAQTV